MEDNTVPIAIKVFGIGGAGGNAVTMMMEEGIQSATTIAMNTDENHLRRYVKAHKKVLLGRALTSGLGAGGSPEMGRKAAEMSKEEIAQEARGTQLAFITAGMGGGTGTGASPVVARVIKEETNATTVAMVTYPFVLEGIRLKVAQRGIKELLKEVDTVVIIDNNRLSTVAANLPMMDAFRLANSIITKAVKGISDTITYPSLMNIDFADVRSVMNEGGVGFIAVGQGSGPDKVDKAVESTLHNPLLEVSYDGATGALIHLEGGPQLTLGEAMEVAKRISEQFDPSANVKVGARIHPRLGNEIRVTVVVTGVKSPYILGGKRHEPAAVANDLLPSL